MEKSSIHFENIKKTSQSHNLRLRDFDYVRKELTPLNKSYGDMTSHNEVINELKTLIKEKTGRSAQAKTKILIEGVFLFKKEHTNNELFQAAKRFGIEFNVKVKELHIHRDEGHWNKDTKIWKPNFHAHIVVENVNRNTGKTVKWNRDDLSNIQDFFAEILNMERGIKSNKKHLSALEYKVQKELKNLDKIMKAQENTKNKEALLLRSKIFNDYYSNKLDFNAKLEFQKFLTQHPLGKEFKELVKTKKNTTNNKNRGYKR